jgi:hypothetical protein
MTYYDPRQCDLLALLDRPAAPVAPPLTPAARHTAATGAPTSAKRRRRGCAAPVAPSVVVTDPQLPPLGAVAKVDGRWHVWRKDALIGTVVGWGVIRPENHPAHAGDAPPRLNSKGWIAEPFPADAIVHIGGHCFTVKWSEHGFSLHHDGRHLLHFSAVAGCAIAAAEIAKADDHFQSRIATLCGAQEPGDPLL